MHAVDFKFHNSSFNRNLKTILLPAKCSGFSKKVNWRRAMPTYSTADMQYLVMLQGTKITWQISKWVTWSNQFRLFQALRTSSIPAIRLQANQVKLNPLPLMDLSIHFVISPKFLAAFVFILRDSIESLFFFYVCGIKSILIRTVDYTIQIKSIGSGSI